MRRKTHRAGEFELIARHFAPLARGFAGALELTDDAAFVPAEPGTDLVVTSDALVEGVHFLPDDPPDMVARKALRVNLSDLAAKGAVPRGYLLDIVLPDAIDEAWIAVFADGLRADQAEFGAILIGGDTTSTPGPLTLAVTVMGPVPAGKMLRRSQAQPEDDIYVTGTIGDAALGLLVRRGGLGGLDAAARDHLERRYRVPEPRVALGPKLIGLAHAAMDVSDGLVADLGHICDTSRVGAVIEEARVPLSPAAAAAVAADPSLMDRVLAGGDDYEILFTAPRAAAAALMARAAETGVRLTRIGAVRRGAGVAVMRPDGSMRSLARGGWEHF